MAEAPVVNASPLVVLSKAERLDLLRLVGETVLVPEPVAVEIRTHSADAAVHALDSEAWLIPAPTIEIPRH